MRLLNAANLTFHEFEGSSIPPYAILSHRWEGEEVTYQEFRKRSFATKGKSGFKKILLCCEQALEDNIDFVWVDTCCIDKSLSAELSGAINSMYTWYKRSTVCYVFLSDVYLPREIMDQFELQWGRWCHKEPHFVSQVMKSQWWTRGWTLQELIAPRDVVFFVNDSPSWCKIGTRYKLLELVASRTGIERGILLGGDVMTCSVAQRMSWASERETTRTEDLAYSLLGPFGVHMPLLYGEGNKAFLRLQEEIMKSTDDQTLFAWQLGFESMLHDLCGPLAPHPSKFRGASNLLPAPDADFQSPYSMTNKGLMLEVPIVHQGDDPYGVVILHCGTYNTRSGLPVVRLGPPGTNRYARDARYIGPLMTVAAQAHTPRIIFMNQEPGVRVERQLQIQVEVSPDALALFPIVHSDTCVYHVPYLSDSQGHRFHNSRRRGAILLSDFYYTHHLLVLFNIER